MQVKTPEDLGSLVRERRAELRLSQTELAEAAGVTRLWVSKVEAGHPGAEFGRVLRLVRALDLGLDLMPVVRRRHSGRTLAELLAAHQHLERAGVGGKHRENP